MAKWDVWTIEETGPRCIYCGYANLANAKRVATKESSGERAAVVSDGTDAYRCDYKVGSNGQWVPPTVKRWRKMHHNEALYG